ncbi:hypothetical protein WJX74_000169 [Apatococcus lobatus]|uniref:Coenzyme Q-binding protein COQ10 START domain-containing protein n=1 Tax=Apatococcus lobatus TaxID=904363 RepID=A0AAW1QBY1_9CHLO
MQGVCVGSRACFQETPVQSRAICRTKRVQARQILHGKAAAANTRGSSLHGRSRRLIRRSSLACRATAAGLGSLVGPVAVEMEKGRSNSRHLSAGVEIAAPVSIVWAALTDYDNLGVFIPGLAENRCLSRRPDGCTLLQRGEEALGFGIKFSATVVLQIQEHAAGLPGAACLDDREALSRSSAPNQGPLPFPRSGTPGAPAMDISFRLQEGDFQAFCGVWRMQQGHLGPQTCRLSYCVFVRPQVWLPVALVQARIRGEIAANLQAVGRHSERIFLGMSSLHTSCQQLGISLERAEADLTAISHRLTQEFQERYEGQGANPHSLLLRIKRLHRELPEVKQSCWDMYNAKQAFVDQTKSIFQHNNGQLALLQQKAGMKQDPADDASTTQLYTALDQWKSSEGTWTLWPRQCLSRQG